MRKGKVFKVSIVPLLIFVLLTHFIKIIKTTSDVYYKMSSNEEELVYNYPSLNKLAYKDNSHSVLYFKNDFLGFKEALAFRESQGRYKIVNKFGFLGKYQFAEGTLALVGVYDTQEFLNSPLLQEKAFIANLSRNKWVLRKYIKAYAGKNIGGVHITESGILAAAHLAGPRSVKKYLNSQGKYEFKDGFGTSIKEYLLKFNAYDVSIVPQNRNAKATHKKLLIS